MGATFVLFRKGGYKKDKEKVKKNILGTVSDVRSKVTLDWIGRRTAMRFMMPIWLQISGAEPLKGLVVRIVLNVG